MRSRKTVVFPVRVDDSTMERLDAIRELFRDKTHARAKELGAPLISRSDAMRWIIDLGLAEANTSLKKTRTRR